MWPSCILYLKTHESPLQPHNKQPKWAVTWHQKNCFISSYLLCEACLLLTIQKKDGLTQWCVSDLYVSESHNPWVIRSAPWSQICSRPLFCLSCSAVSAKEERVTHYVSPLPSQCLLLSSNTATLGVCWFYTRQFVWIACNHTSCHTEQSECHCIEAHFVDKELEERFLTVILLSFGGIFKGTKFK